VSIKGLAGMTIAVLALAPAAQAQGAQADGAQAGGAQGGSTSFEQACVDLVQGRPPAGGPEATDALRKACGDLMSARVQAQRDAQERAQLRAAQAAQPQGATGTGQGAAAAGETGSAQGQGSAAAQGLGAAFAEAGRELVGQGGRRPMGLSRGGQPYRFSLMTDPVGWFTGLGVNAIAFGSLLPKVSWTGGARYSRTDATNGSVDTFGVMAGADYFVIGRDNEGLRVGPRIELALGNESFHTTTFGWLGMSGELGYNFIASNGITGALALGVGGRIAGHKQTNFTSFTGGEFGPYARVGLGYSW
jgi:hypothetical protein